MNITPLTRTFEIWSDTVQHNKLLWRGFANSPMQAYEFSNKEAVDYFEMLPETLEDRLNDLQNGVYREIKVVEAVQVMA